MGYWPETTFHPAAVWGDQPADHLDLGAAIREFTRDVGRLPSKIELLAGILFQIRGTDLPDEPGDSTPGTSYAYADLTTAQVDALVTAADPLHLLPADASDEDIARHEQEHAIRIAHTTAGWAAALRRAADAEALHSEQWAARAGDSVRRSRLTVVPDPADDPTPEVPS